MGKGKFPNWWGGFEIPTGSCARWEIGPFLMWIQRNEEDWTVTRERHSDPFRDHCEVEIPADPPPTREGSHTEPQTGLHAGTLGEPEPPQRYAALEGSRTVYIAPAHADRPVVITPEQSFSLPPRRTVHLFVSLPLWLQFRDEPGGVPLIDDPLFRPSDTWHGPNTRVGQVCYASRTRAAFAPIGRLPHRIVTPFEVRNRSEKDLKVERIKLPTPHLSVLVDDDGGLWTEAVIFEQPAGTDPPDVRIEPEVMNGPKNLELLSGPRTRMEKKFVWHAFGDFFANGW
ncbi:MAG: hypothetical protein R3E97_14150 [Candidatus Eisenbacteria bacterium]